MALQHDGVSQHNGHEVAPLKIRHVMKEEANHKFFAVMRLARNTSIEKTASEKGVALAQTSLLGEKLESLR